MTLSISTDATVLATPAPAIVASKLLESVVGLRYLRQPKHPRLHSSWFTDALNWARCRGDLLTAVCEAPLGLPAFLLPRHGQRLDWEDQLCRILEHPDDVIWSELTIAFGQRVPDDVERAFVDVRAGTGQLIRELNDYVTHILEPRWLPVSMTLNREADRWATLPRVIIGEQGRPAPGTYLAPTVFGIRSETFVIGDGRWVVTVPVSEAGALFGERAPRAPIGDLIGHSRAVILYALEVPLSLREIARATGQRRQNVVHHLDVLIRTRLVNEIRVGDRPRSRYERTLLAQQLLAPAG